MYPLAQLNSVLWVVCYQRNIIGKVYVDDDSTWVFQTPVDVNLSAAHQ